MAGFNAYLRTPKGNRGQMQGALAGPTGKWIRHVVPIRIPPGEATQFISLQLHRAAGTVLVDNVVLRRCP